ncbi:MAG: DUF4291 domain-containing protein [Sandaracinus sp.]|nr:DUF4291 domain-containing protein [Sandaracinus sp.]MCB9621232.1 DUF4291 domain-containing protein [Sandaracinus sp.]
MLALEPYESQVRRWPTRGRHLLAQHDADSIVVYQAYRLSIGRWAAEHGRLGGGGFSFDRMSWIKPNFLWMMYRCGWARKEGQEVVLALRLKREAFDDLLAHAVESSFHPEAWPDRDAWQAAVRRSDVRLQWDPDHAPSGSPVERRAVQIGLRGEALRGLAGSALLDVEDVTPLVHEQREQVGTSALLTPRETVYEARDEATKRRLRLD